MTGQVVVEFDGRKVPKITFKGDIIPINMRMVDRFLRKAYRIHCYELTKASAKAKLEKLAKAKPVQTLTPGAVIDLKGKLKPKAAPISKVGISPAVTKPLSEDKKNDEERNAGDAKRSGRVEGVKKAGVGGAGGSIKGPQGIGR